MSILHVTASGTKMEAIVGLYAKRHSYSTSSGDTEKLELELRYATDWTNFLQFLTRHKQLDSPVITSFTRQSAGIRQESWYVNGTKQSSSTIIKKQLETVQDRRKGVKAIISSEKPYNGQLRQIDYAALKFRVPFVLNNWSYEPTIIVELKHNDLSFIKQSIDTLFSKGKATITDYYNAISLYNMANSAVFNLEAEWISTGIPNADDLTQAVNIITATTENTNVFTKISELLLPKQRPRSTLKELLNNAVGLNRINLNVLSSNLDNYLVSEKNDGETCLLLVGGESVTIVTALYQDESSESLSSPDCILLGEKMTDEIVLYDVLYVRETERSAINLSYTERLEMLDRIIASGLPKTEPTIRRKTILPAREGITKIKSSKDTDGLIFTENIGYNSAKIWKYKPLEHNTIDFMLVAADDNILTLYPKAAGLKSKTTKAYILCSTISERDYKLLGLEQLSLTNWDTLLRRELGEDYLAIKDKIPIPFRPAMDTECFIYLDEVGKKHSDADNKSGQIYEFRYLVGGKPGEKWQAIRRRNDREIGVKTGTGYGNYYRTAEDVFFNYFDPVTLADIGDKQSGYFRTEKKTEYREMILFNNFVKHNVMQQLQNISMIVDLSSGKGQDLVTYNGLGVKCGKFIDIDSLAIATLLERRYTLSDPKIYRYAKPPATNMLVTTAILDLNADWKDVYSTIVDTGLLHNPKAVICNLAIHYLIPDGFNNIFRLVDSLLEKGGKFIFSTFCGEKIAGMLDKSPEITFDTERYSIKYSDKKAKKISVKLPFSDGEYYDEYLVNTTEIIDYFVEKRYKLVQRVYFDEYSGIYKKKIDPADLSFSGLYVFVTLVKL